MDAAQSNDQADPSVEDRPLAVLVACLRRVVDARFAAATLISDGSVQHLLAPAGADPKLLHALPWHAVIRRGRPALRQAPPWLAVPLRGGDGRVVGLLQAWGKPAGFTAEDRARVEALAGVVRALWHLELPPDEEPSDLAVRFRGLTRTSALPWEADPESYRFTYVGPQAEELFGYARAAWKEPDFWRDHIHAEDREHAWSACKTAVAAGSANFQFEYRMQTADGRMVWIHDLVHIERGADGRPRTMSGFMIDVTARKEAEAARNQRLAAQTRLAELASLFAHTRGAEDEQALRGALRGLQELLAIDIFECISFEAGEVVDCTCGPEGCGLGRRRVDVDVPPRGWLEPRLRRGEAVVIDELAALPPEAAPLAAYLRGRGLGAALIVPLDTGAETGAVAGLAARREARGWDDDTVREVQVLLHLLAVARARDDAESTLRESEERYRSLVENSPFGICELDPSGGLLSANRAARTMYQRQGEGGSSFFAILPGPDRERIAGLLGQASGGETVHFQLETHTGQVYMTCFVPIRDGAGAVQRVMAILQDVSQRRRALDALHASEERFRRLVEDQSELIVRWRPGGGQTYVNPSYCRYFGTSADEAVGASFFDLVAAADRAEVLRRIEALSPAAPVCHAEHRVVRGDGSLSWVHWTDRAFFDEQGAVVELLSVGRDVTDRKTAELALLRTRQSLEDAQARAHLGSWELDLERGEGTCSKELGRLFSVPAGRPLSPEALLARVHPEDRPRLGALLSLAPGEKSTVELRGHPDDGPRVFVHTVERLERDGRAVLEGTTQDISARRLAEEARRKNEQLLETTHEVANVGGWELDLESDELRWTSQTCRIHEVPLDYAPDVATAIGFYAPEAQPRIRAAVEEAIEQGTPFDLELPLITARGRRLWVRAKGDVERRNGKVARLYGAFQDITERRAAEQALKASEERFRLVFNHQFQFTVILSPEGRVLEINEPPIASYGLAVDDFVGKLLWETPSLRGLPQAKVGIRRLLRAALVSDEPVFGESDFLDSERRMRRAEVVYKTIRCPDGAPRFVLMQARDVTGQRAAEEALRAEKELSERVVFSNVDGVVAFDHDARITLCNPALERMFNRAGEDIVGKTLLEAFPFLAGIAEARFYEQALQGRAAVARDRPFPLADGGEGWFEARYSPLRDGQGHVVGGVGLVRDITARKAAERELTRYRQELEELVEQRTVELAESNRRLARSNRDLEQFASIASHDLQEPLRVVSRYLQLLQKSVARQLAPEDQRLLTVAFEGARRMGLLIEDVLTYSRIGQGPVEPRPVALDELVERARSALRVAIEECRAEVVCSGLPVVLADAGQIVQVLQNLLGNSIKFRGSRTPRIELSARREEGFWRIDLRDNGIGIEEQDLERIFVLFQRVHRRAAVKGTGIGLAICKRIIEGHGGSITVRSVRGEGTTFSFTLPEAPEPGPPDAVEVEARVLASEPVVLVVDDEIFNRDATGLTLQGLGYRVHTAASSAEALAIAARPEARLDLAILDVHLAGESGLDLAEALRKILPRMPIVFFTGDSSPQLLASCALDEVFQLVKGCSLDDLQQALNDALAVRARPSE